jgi:hypothetical protein
MASQLSSVFSALYATTTRNLSAPRKTLGAVAAPEAIIVIDRTNYVFNGTRWGKPFPVDPNF